MAEAAAIAELADESFTADKVEAELAYLDRPLSAGFERPYGWGWLLYLHLEASRHAGPPLGIRAGTAGTSLRGAAEGYLAKLTYPIRVGTHFNTAFALILALEWAEAFDPTCWPTRSANGPSTGSAHDRDCQAWEPGGDEFLSPALIEALCMARVLPQR